MIVVDNGMEFHSKDLEAAAFSLLIDIRFCPAGQPWWKGAVERFFRTLGESLIHRIPGTTFSNIAEKGNYNSVKESVITEDDLNEVIHMWICDVYHQDNLRTMSRTPHSLWLERICAVRQNLPASSEMLDVSLSSICRRTLFHYGISLNNLNYSSSELQKYRRKYGELNLQVRWDQSDLGFIYVVIEADNINLKVPCSWFSYANGLSLWLHKAIRDDALSYEGPESKVKLDEAKARIREKFEKALANKKLVTRKKAARAQPSFTHAIQPISRPSPELFHTQNSHVINSSADDAEKEQEEIPDFDVVVKY